MFTTIYKNELKYWLKQPAVYFYFILFFGAALVTMWGMSAERDFGFTGEILNSASKINRIGGRFFLVALFVFPGVIGMSVFRDYKSKIHSILYSYPFSKRDYLLGKFLSSFTIVSIIVLSILLGMIMGFSLTGSASENLVVFDARVYLQEFFVYMLPNMIFISVIVFAVVTFTRNVYVGYITVVLLILLRKMFLSILGSFDKDYLVALLDPFGGEALKFYTRFWTVLDQNQNYMPLEGVVLHNRFLWLAISLGLMFWTYYKFQFSEQAVSFFKNKKEGKVSLKRNFGSITKVVLPTVDYDYSFSHQVKSMLSLTWLDFKYIVKNWMFISIVIVGAAAVYFIVSNANPRMGTIPLPVTSEMLMLPSLFFSGVINMLTFLYAGMLIHRGKLAKMNQLIDISSLPNWTFLTSKFFAVVMMQIVLLSLLLFAGIFNQTMKGYYDFEIGHYLFELYGLNLIHFIIWAFLAVFVQSLFDNPFLGFFILILMAVGMIFLPQPAEMLNIPIIGEAFLRYNQTPGAPPTWLAYSNMDGYGPMTQVYIIYKAYWFLAGLLFFVAAFLFWKRGLTFSMKERISLAKDRLTKGTIAFSSIVFIGFISSGIGLYKKGNFQKERMSEDDRKEIFFEKEKKYKRFEYLPQPEIKHVSIEMDMFPSKRDFNASGFYWIVNKENIAIDTLILSYLPDVNTKYDLDKPYRTAVHENVGDYGYLDILVLDKPLMPNDTIKMTFSVHNNPNSLMKRTNYVKTNGTFIRDDAFLRLGNWLSWVREHYRWNSDRLKAHPTESIAWNTRYANTATFEATVSTSADQKAIAPGELVKEWKEDGRNYFRYETKKEIINTFLFLSGDYSVQSENWNGIDLEINHDKKHPYNVDRIMEGKVAALEYCTKYFSPYQYDHLKTVEFSQILSATAHGFPGVIPSGENAGFIADVKECPSCGVDYAYGTSVHETAHMWWGYQVSPADVLGGKMVSESLAEYVTAMVRLHNKGRLKLQTYLEGALDIYLQQRTGDKLEEQALMYAYPSQNYIHYMKGVLVFCSLADAIGEENLNGALSKYLQLQKDKVIPPTSVAMVDLIREVTPDSLSYLIEDMFETVTLHDNQLVDWTSTETDNGKYLVEVEFLTSKFRNSGKGQRNFSTESGDSLSYQIPGKDRIINSYPLEDYIEIGAFGNQELEGELVEKELYLKKYKIKNIHNKISFLVDEKPLEVAVDPYLRLIDVNRRDNRR